MPKTIRRSDETKYQVLPRAPLRERRGVSVKGGPSGDLDLCVCPTGVLDDLTSVRALVEGLGAEQVRKIVDLFE